MRLHQALSALLLALALFGAGWFARGWGVERERRMLRDSAAQSREASRVSDSLRLASRLAADAARAEMTARLVALQQKARTLGAAASSLVTAEIARAPDTCLPGLQRLRFAWSLHLQADSTLADATARVMRADSLAIQTARSETLNVIGERNLAQARLDRELAMPGKKSGFLPGVVVGALAVVGMVIVAR